MLILIDDDELFRSALAANLREDGYQVLDYASLGSVPLDRMSGVEALLTDREVGEEDGLRFADRFHRALPSVPVVMMTAFAPPSLEAEVARRRYLTLLHKPLEYDELIAVLDEVGGNRRAPE